MKLEYTAQGKFVPETQELAEKFQADAVMLIVFGSRTKGSGACCEMRVEDPEGLAWVMVEQLHELAYSIEADIKGLAKKAEVKSDKNGHEQTELEHPSGDIRPGEPVPGDPV